MAPIVTQYTCTGILRRRNHVMKLDHNCCYVFVYYQINSPSGLACRQLAYTNNELLHLDRFHRVNDRTIPYIYKIKQD